MSPRRDSVQRREYLRAWHEKNRESNREKRRAWYRANLPRLREQRRRHRIKLRYGLTTPEYDAKLSGQGGVCDICKKSAWGKEGPHVDHNHASGQVRGILCGKCNRMIGFALEDKKTLIAAVEYLKKWELLAVLP